MPNPMGWKDFLRPIRDRLRDNLPQPQTPISDDERRQHQAHRSEDFLRGFIYLESFQELDDWLPEHVQSCQKSNTPLLHRPRCCGVVDATRSSITLIHDYSGNYHPYEQARSVQVSAPSYACNYMQHIDRFVYFSHKLVCVPPASWTNTLHRNGVRSLGTFLVEPQSIGIERILECNSDNNNNVTYPVAEQLICIAKTCQFDGYLINIEKTFPIFSWNLDHLVGFLDQLRRGLGEGNVLWYDALTVQNEVKYQNGLTELNLRLAEAAGAIATNYAWTPEIAHSSKALAQASGIHTDNVILGIDLWAQNSDHGGPPRRTWPRDGGGGTGTGRAVAELAKIGLASGLFAAAWPYEHFDSHGQDVETSMWTGRSLPDDLACGCKPGNVHESPLYRQFPILMSSREASAGSTSYFYTDFAPPFLSNYGATIAQLGTQSVQLRVFQTSTRHSIITQYDHQEGGLAISLGSEHDLLLSQDWRLCGQLYQLHIHDQEPLYATIRFSKADTVAKIGFHFDGVDFAWYAPKAACRKQTTSIRLPEGRTITGFSVVVELEPSTNSTSYDERCLLTLHSVCISRKATHNSPYQPCIRDLRRGRSADGSLSVAMILWSISQVPATSHGSTSFSPVTGPFAYFAVEAGDILSARVHATEIHLSPAEEEELSTTTDSQIIVKGYKFGGELLSQSSFRWHDDDDIENEWDLVVDD